MTKPANDDARPEVADPPIAWNELEQLTEEALRAAVDPDQNLRVLFDAIFPRKKP
jgi:hypothetical protein